MARVFVGVGSNIEPRRHIRQALQRLGERFDELVISPAYECPAVGFEGGDFINLVLAFTSDADPAEVLKALRRIEEQCGRVRGDKMRSRSLDLDLLLYGDSVIDSPQLRLPRADILEYAFVLKPLADIAPQARHPESGETYAALWAQFDAADQPLKRVDLN